jgi:hypothetical protein
VAAAAFPAVKRYVSVCRYFRNSLRRLWFRFYRLTASLPTACDIRTSYLLLLLLLPPRQLLLLL